jgi:hypothetical protein
LQSQANSRTHPPTHGDINAAPGDQDDTRDQVMREMAKKANLERQAALRTDAEKLLKLATDLNAYVEKSNEHVLSVDVIKRAEEIEKLARSVKDKMKGPN